MFLMRFIDFGFVGTYLYYLFFIPAAFTFFLIVIKYHRNNMIAIVGLVVLFFFLLVDLFLLYKPIVNGLMLVGWVIVSLCWAKTGCKSIRL